MIAVVCLRQPLVIDGVVMTFSLPQVSTLLAVVEHNLQPVGILGVEVACGTTECIG